jgi:hypothetical protein
VLEHGEGQGVLRAILQVHTCVEESGT